MSQEIPYCEDCKYFQPSKDWVFWFSSARKKYAKCTHKATHIYRGEQGANYCSVYRKYDCGPEGKYFEAKT